MEENKELNEEVKETEESNTGLESGGSNPELESGLESKPKKKKTWLWVLGWICIFPLPLTILLLRKKDMKPALKYGIIAVAWIITGLLKKSNFGSSHHCSVVNEYD